MSNYNNGNNSNNKGANYRKSYERDSIQTKSSDKGMIIAVAILTIVVAVSCAVLVIFVKKDNPEKQPENITVVDKKEPENQPEKSNFQTECKSPVFQNFQSSGRGAVW